MKENLVRRALAIILLNFGTTLNACTVSHPGQPRVGKKPPIRFEKLGRVLRQSRIMAECTVNFPMLEIKPQFLDRPAHGLVTIVTELPVLPGDFLDVLFYRNKKHLIWGSCRASNQ